MFAKKQLDQDLQVLQQEEVALVSGGLIGPDQDLSQFPRKFWPVINPGALVLDQQIVAKSLVVR